MKSRFLILLLLLLVSCGPGKDALLHQTVSFKFGEWNLALAEKLLADGANVNSRDEHGYTPLHNSHGIGCDYHADEADYEDAEEALRLLLAAGADVHALTPMGTRRNAEGLTPLENTRKQNYTLAAEELEKLTQPTQ